MPSRVKREHSALPSALPRNLLGEAREREARPARAVVADADYRRAVCKLGRVVRTDVEVGDVDGHLRRLVEEAGRGDGCEAGCGRVSGGRGEGHEKA